MGKAIYRCVCNRTYYRLYHLALPLNHEQQESKVGTTPVLQMCKIPHSMTEGFPLFSFKTI